MGCGASSSVVHTSPALEATGAGGSMILDRNNSAAQTYPGPIDFQPTKGGSYIIGRKQINDWEPGDVIERPAVFTEAKHYWLRLPQGRAVHLSYSAVSEQGRTPRPPNKANQDSYLCIEKLGSDPNVVRVVDGSFGCGVSGSGRAFTREALRRREATMISARAASHLQVLFGVFDGHGPRGEDASNFCRINLPDIVVQRPEFASAPLDAVANSFEPLHRRFTSPTVAARGGVDTTVSGTTAITIAIAGNQWLCANVGDSRAMMGSLSARGNDLLARPLSVDHKPQRPDETARINRSGARILSETALGIAGGSDDKLYVCRVYNGAIRYGVLFTRSIGDADAHEHLGLTCKPELKRGVLSESDRFMVLASDGCWDHMDEADVARIVDDAGDGADAAHAAAVQIVAEAKRRWDASSDRRRDDITALVIMIRFATAADADAAGAPTASATTTLASAATVSAAQPNSLADATEGAAAVSAAAGAGAAAEKPLAGNADASASPPSVASAELLLGVSSSSSLPAAAAATATTSESLTPEERRDQTTPVDPISAPNPATSAEDLQLQQQEQEQRAILASLSAPGPGSAPPSTASPAPSTPSPPASATVDGVTLSIAHSDGAPPPAIHAAAAAAAPALHTITASVSSSETAAV